MLPEAITFKVRQNLRISGPVCSIVIEDKLTTVILRRGARGLVSSLRQLHADSVSVYYIYMTVWRGGLLVVRVFTMTSVYWSIIKLHSISSACVYSDTRHSCSE